MSRLIALPLLCTALLPLWVSDSLIYPFVTGRVLMFRLLVSIAVVVLVGGLALESGSTSRRFAIRPVGIAALLLMAWLAVTTLTSVDVTRSVWGSVERMDGAIGLFCVALFALTLAVGLKGSRRLWMFAACLTTAVSTLVCLLSWSELPRWSGPLGSPIYLSMYVAMTGVGLAAWGLQQRTPWSATLAVGALLTVHSWVLWNTQTRGAVVAIAAAGAMALVVPSARRISWRRVGAALSSLIVVAAGVGAFRRSQLFRESPFLWRFGEPGWLGDRPAFYEAAWAAIVDRPLFGWGVGNIDLALSSHAVPSLSQNVWPDRTHSVLLDVAVATGVPGVLCLIAVLGLALASALHTARPLAERRWLLASLTAWTVGFSTSFPDVIGWICLATLIAYITATDSHRPTVRMTLPRPFVVAAMPVVAMVLLVVGVGQYGVAVVASDTLALVNTTTNPYDLVSQARTAADKHSMVQTEAALMMSRGLADWELVPVSADLEQQIETVYSEAIRRRPTDSRLRTAHARTLLAIGRPERALGELSTARRLAPGNAWIPLMEVPLHLRRNDIERALSAAEDAVALFPSDEAVMTLASLLLFTGDRARCEAMLLPRADKRPAILLDPRLVRASEAANGMPWLSELWLRHAEQDRPVFRRKLTAFLKLQE